MAPVDTLEDINARIGALQEEIHELVTRRQEEIRGLVTRRNALTGLCCLPPETIVHIIRLLPATSLPNEDHSYHSRTSYDVTWTRMTRVCAHLRNITLGAGVLWSVVPIKPSPKDAWTKLCIERAGNTPLTLCLNTSRCLWKEDQLAVVADLVVDAMPRCRALVLELGHCGSYGEHEFVTRILEMKPNAPLLRSLSMESTSSEHSLTITHQFLGGYAAGLRQLCLNAPLTIDNSPHFSFVQVLELELSSFTTVEALGTLWELLECTPLVEELTLHRTTSPYYADPSIDAAVCLGYADRGPITLTHLRILRVLEHVGPLALLLRVLPLPREALHAKVIMQGTSEHWAPGDAAYDSVFACLLAFWSAHAGEDGLPDGTLTAYKFTYMRIPAGAANILRFESGTAFSFSCAARIAEAHAVVDQVTTLVLQGDRTGPGTAGTDLSGAAYMRNLQRAVVAGPQTAAHLQGVERWLKQRKKAYGSLARVEIYDPGPKIKGKTEELITRIRTLGLAQVVNLVIKQPPPIYEHRPLKF
jgi:hypothetical protein